MPSSKKLGCKGLSVLITSGPTSVPVDGVRVITNRSTGTMGRLLANAFATAGAKVTLLEGAVTTDISLKKGIAVQKFYLFDELAALLRRELAKQPAVVIHAAAVSDYRLKKVFKGKLDSRSSLKVELVPTTKLITLIKRFAPATVLVGFKLEDRLPRAEQEARKLIQSAHCDIVVANTEYEQYYSARWISRAGVRSKTFLSKSDLVKALVKVI